MNDDGFGWNRVIQEMQKEHAPAPQQKATESEVIKWLKKRAEANAIDAKKVRGDNEQTAYFEGVNDTIKEFTVYLKGRGHGVLHI